MALRITPGYKSLNLYFDQPTDAFDVDDVDTTGTVQVADNSYRMDLDGLKVWISDTSWGASDPTGDPYYNGPFQGYLSIDKLTTTSASSLADNKIYYIKYALISSIDRDSYSISAEQSATTLDVAVEIQGWLTRDPIEIPTDGDGTNPVYTGATGSFTVYKYSQDISTSTDVTYSVVSGSSVGGIAVSFGTGANKNKYTVTAITDLTGTITLRATYTDPQNTSRIIIIDQILNVSKRRPGQTAPLVVLTGNGQAFVRAANSSTISPSSIRLTATTSNITNPTYTWYVDGVSVSVSGISGVSVAGNELTINSSIFSGTPPEFKLIKVVVGSSVGGVSVFDQQSIYYLQEGSDALAIGLVNENQTISLDKNGTVISGSTLTSQIVLVRGSTVLTSGVTYAIKSGAIGINTSNILNTTTGAITIPVGQVTAISAEVTFQATYLGTTLEKKLTINTVQDGQTGADAIIADLTSEADVVFAANDGTGYTLPTGNQLKLYKGGALVSSGVSYSGTATQNGLTLTINSATGVITLSGTWTSNQESFTLTATYNSIAYTTIYTIAKSRTGQTGASAKGIDIGNVTNFKRNSSGVYTPSTVTLTAILQNLNSVTYSWSIIGGTTVNSIQQSVTITPSSNISSISVTLNVTDTSVIPNVIYSKTVTMSIAEDGTAGLKTISGQLYYNAASASAPSAPTSGLYNFTNNTITVNPATWQLGAPTYAAGNTNKYWYINFTAIESSSGSGSGNLNFGSNQVTQAIGFSGLVTFTTANEAISDGTNTLSFGSNGTTKIDGGNITTGSISADRIDTRNLNIKDASGNIIFGAGTALNWSNISTNYPSSLDNTNVTANSIGAIKTDLTNAPSGILNSNIYISKSGATFTLNGGGTSQTIDATGLAVVKTDLTNAPIGIKNDQISITEANGVVTLSNAGTGTITVVSANNKITSTNATTFIADAAIQNAQVANLSAAKITTGTLDAARIGAGTIDAGKLVIGGSQTGSYIRLFDNKIEVYDSGVLRVKLGNLA